MEESFLLKHYGHLNISEQINMTAEERAWWLKRLDDEHKKEQEASKKSPSAPGSLPKTPGQPPI